MPTRVLTSLSLTLIVGALSIFHVCVHAFTVADTPTLEGTTWAISDSNHQPYVFEFMPDSKLRYVAANGTTGRGSWKQTNDTVAFDINGHFVQYKGTRRRDEMQGEAKYRSGTSLKWTAFRQQALVTTPNAPKYPAIAAAAHATGTVLVDVSLDSTGQVNSASVVEGHALLRKICEIAAKDWRFNSTDEVAIRKVRLIFSFSLLAPDCKTDVTTVAPEYRLSYLVNVRRRQQCPTY
jgi:TonB family protein